MAGENKGFVLKGLWGKLADHWSEEEYYNALKDHLSHHAGLCGLIAGFTYIVANAPPQFTEKSDFISIYNRKSIYGVLSLSAFIISFIGTLISTVLYTQLIICGKDQVRFFGTKFSVFLTHPSTFLALGIVCMVLAVLFAIGGYYSGAAFYIVIIIFVFVSSYFGYVSWKVNSLSKNHMLGVIATKTINRE